MTPTTTGDRVRSERKAAGLTQQDLADAAGVSKQAISKIENGSTQNPEAATLEPIGRLLGIETRWFLTGRGPKHAGGHVAESHPNYDVRQARVVRPDPATMVSAYTAVIAHAFLAERQIFLTNADDMALVCDAYERIARGEHVLPGEEHSSDLEAAIRQRSRKPGEKVDHGNKRADRASGSR